MESNAKANRRGGTAKSYFKKDSNSTPLECLLIVMSLKNLQN